MVEQVEAKRRDELVVRILGDVISRATIDEVIAQMKGNVVVAQQIIDAGAITTPAQERQATSVLAELQSVIKYVETCRLKATEGLRTALKKTKEYVDGQLAPGRGVERELDKLIKGYVAECRRIEREAREAEELRQAERRALEAKHAAEGREVPGPKPAEKVILPAKMQHTAKTRSVPKWRIVDFAQVPDHYKEINRGAVQKAMNALTPIPGIEYYSEDTILTR
jgi:hypothetical protein